MDNMQQEILDGYAVEVAGLVQGLRVGEDGEHVWSAYENVTAIMWRLQEMHNEISEMEVFGRDWPEIKKFRTLVIDPTIDRLEKLAAFESRKITGKSMEVNLDRA